MNPNYSVVVGTDLLIQEEKLQFLITNFTAGVKSGMLYKLSEI